MALKSLIFSIVGLLMAVSTCRGDSLQFILIPIETNENQLTVFLEIQTYDILTNDTVHLDIFIGTRHLSNSFEKLADVRYSFQLLPEERPRYGAVMHNAMYINLSGITYISGVTMKARFNDLATMTINPTLSLGTEHRIITYCQVLGNCLLGFAGIQGVSTNVTVYLPRNTIINIAPNDNITMDRSNTTISIEFTSNQAMLLECLKCDLTNTVIQSTHNIAVFAGATGTVVRKGIKESIFLTQIPPVSSWGREFIVLNSNVDPAGDIFRIISRFNTTMVHIEGSGTIRIGHTGQWIQKLIHKTNSLHITADKPIMIAQLLYNGVDHAAMIYVPPTEQFFHHPLACSCKFNITLILHRQSLHSLTVYGMRSTSLEKISNTVFMTSSFISTSNDLDAVCQIIDVGNIFGLVYTTYPVQGTSYINFHYISGYFYKKISIARNKTMVPGDLVDNDEDGQIDEDDCSSVSDTFYYQNLYKNFNDSQNDCDIRNTILAKLDTKERYDKAVEYLRNMKTILPVYVGLSGSPDQGYFWTDGSPSSFFQWSPTHVTNTAINKQCVALLIDTNNFGLFSEHDCTSPLPSLCTGWADLKDCKITPTTLDNRGISFLFPVWYLSGDLGEINIDLAVTSNSNTKVFLSMYQQAKFVKKETYTGSFSKTVSNLKVGYPDLMTVWKVESTNEVSLHMLIYLTDTGVRKSISTFLLPTDVWGLDYYAASYCTTDCVSYCLITAASYDTKLRLILKDTNMTLVVILINNNFTVVNNMTVDLKLDKYQYALLKSEQDLTGTYIKGDNPFSVICGSDCPKFTIGEQLLPVKYFSSSSLSNIFQINGTEKTNMDYFIRVMTSESNTYCSITTYESIYHNWQERLVHPGDFFQFDIDGEYFINCNRAVFVWAVQINDNVSGTMTLTPSDSQYYYSKEWFTFDTSINVVQQLYAFKSSTNFPLLYLGTTWSGSRGKVTDMIELTTYNAYTKYNNISFFLWNIGYYDGYAFGTQIAMPLVEPYICELERTLDEDCDGKYDEELCTLAGYNFIPYKYLLQSGKYLADFDFDGNFDEDCAYIVPECYKPTIPFTNIEDYTEGSDTYVTSTFRSLTCFDGYSMINESVKEIVCYSNGNWTPENICVKDCGNPTDDYQNSVILINNSWKVYQNVTMGCADGFSLLGSGVIFCSTNSLWTTGAFNCVSDCVNPTGIVQHSEIQPAVAHFPVLNAYKLSCINGYTLNGNAEIICLENSTWSQPAFSCVPGCPDPRENIPQGIILNYTDGTSFTPGMTIEMACNVSNTLVGNRQMTCQSDGTWNSSLKCIPDCINPRNEIQMANAELQDFTENSITSYKIVYRFKCRLKYKMIGDGSIVCQENSTWSQPMFFCIPCRCPCRRIGNPRYTNVTSEVIHQIQVETTKELAVNKKTLSAYISTKISLPNKKQSEKSVGYLGAILIVLSIGSLIVLDVPLLSRHFKYLLKTIWNMFKACCKC